MQIPELCSLFGTQYALLVRFQLSSGEPCKKLALTFFFRGVGGCVRDGDLLGPVCDFFFLQRPPYSIWRQMLSRPLSRGARDERASNKIFWDFDKSDERRSLYVHCPPLLLLCKTCLCPPSPTD